MVKPKISAKDYEACLSLLAKEGGDNMRLLVELAEGSDETSG